MADMTDVSQMPMPGGGQNQPSSGTYGQGQASADKLKSMIGLPPTKPQQDSAPPVSTMPGGAKPQAPSGPFGLPSAITAPTQRPNVPVNTPLLQQVNPVAQAQAPDQKRLAMLDMLTRNPDVSDSTREWAQHVLRALVENSKQ